MAGIDGIQRQIDPTESGFGPIEADIFSWTDEQREQIMPLPGSLREALDALAKDKDFLLSGGVFSEDLIERWITFKMNEEHNEVCNRPHPYEMELYFSV
jgi:glutamine synthetase